MISNRMQPSVLSRAQQLTIANGQFEIVKAGTACTARDPAASCIYRLDFVGGRGGECEAISNREPISIISLCMSSNVVLVLVLVSAHGGTLVGGQRPVMNELVVSAVYYKIRFKNA